jgi:RNA polymerase sigma factor (TIGR02999 family)
MTDVTKLLAAAHAGEPAAADALLPLVYDELRRLAAARLRAEPPGQTLQPTALVHETYLRLAGPAHRVSDRWDHRGHFFAAAAEAMRRILVENARRKQSGKRGGDYIRAAASPDEFAERDARDAAEVLSVHEALDDLAARSARKAELVKLRYFLGCSVAEAAEVLGVAPKTAEEDWTYARAWLRRRLGAHGSDAAAD